MGEKQDDVNKKNEGEKKSNNDGGLTTVVLKVDLHCEGCAKKVKHSIRKHFNGVESVKADCGSNKLTVVGKVEVEKIKEKVEQKIKKKVELVSPSPQPNKPLKVDDNGDKKPTEKKSQENKSEQNKDKPKEPQVSTVVLKTRVHCEGCAQKIRKIVGKRQGVQGVDVDLQKDTITIKGTMNMKDLLPYLNVKLKRIVELAQPTKDEADKKPKEGGGGGGPPEKPKEGGKGGGAPEKPKEGKGDKKEDGSDKKKGGKGDKKKESEGEKKVDGGEAAIPQENTTKFEINKMEYGGGYPYGGYGYGYNYTYDPRQYGEGSSSHQVVEYWHEPGYSHHPQMFSDENPNACSVM